MPEHTLLKRNEKTETPCYSVSQLVSQLDIAPRTIRFYEEMNLITPRRTGNTRVYTEADKDRLALILRAKRLGFSLREVQTYLDLDHTDPLHQVQAALLHEAVQQRILDLKAQRDVLDTSLSELDEIDRQCVSVLTRAA